MMIMLCSVDSILDVFFDLGLVLLDIVFVNAAVCVEFLDGVVDERSDVFTILITALAATKLGTFIVRTRGRCPC